MTKISGGYNAEQTRRLRVLMALAGMKAGAQTEVAFWIIERGQPTFGPLMSCVREYWDQTGDRLDAPGLYKFLCRVFVACMIADVSAGVRVVVSLAGAFDDHRIKSIVYTAGVTSVIMVMTESEGSGERAAKLYEGMDLFSRNHRGGFDENSFHYSVVHGDLCNRAADFFDEMTQERHWFLLRLANTSPVLQDSLIRHVMSQFHLTLFCRLVQNRITDPDMHGTSRILFDALICRQGK
jgi:hypothetical protein